MRTFTPDPSYKSRVIALPGDYGVELLQRGTDDYAVRYGLQWATGLTYGRACSELGQALMHAYACDGLIREEYEESI